MDEKSEQQQLTVRELLSRHMKFPATLTDVNGRAVDVSWIVKSLQLFVFLFPSTFEHAGAVMDSIAKAGGWHGHEYSAERAKAREINAMVLRQDSFFLAVMYGGGAEDVARVQQESQWPYPFIHDKESK